MKYFKLLLCLLATSAFADMGTDLFSKSWKHLSSHNDEMSHYFQSKDENFFNQVIGEASELLGKNEDGASKTLLSKYVALLRDVRHQILLAEGLKKHGRTDEAILILNMGKGPKPKSENFLAGRIDCRNLEGVETRLNCAQKIWKSFQNSLVDELTSGLAAGGVGAVSCFMPFIAGAGVLVGSGLEFAGSAGEEIMREEDERFYAEDFRKKLAESPPALTESKEESKEPTKSETPYSKFKERADRERKLIHDFLKNYDKVLAEHLSAVEPAPTPTPTPTPTSVPEVPQLQDAETKAETQPPSPSLSPKGTTHFAQELSKPWPATEDYRSMRELRKAAEAELSSGTDLGTGMDYAQFMLEVDVSNRGLFKRIKQEDYKKAVDRYHQVLEKIEKGIFSIADPEEKLKKAMEILNSELLHKYHRDTAGLYGGLRYNNGFNCQGDTQMILGVIHALSLKTSPGKSIGVQVYNDHVQAVLYDGKTQRTVNLVDWNAVNGVEAPIYKPKILIHGFLKKNSRSYRKEPLVNEGSLLIAEPPPGLANEKLSFHPEAWGMENINIDWPSGKSRNAYGSDKPIPKRTDIPFVGKGPGKTLVRAESKPVEGEVNLEVSGFKLNSCKTHKNRQTAEECIQDVKITASKLSRMNSLISPEYSTQEVLFFDRERRRLFEDLPERIKNKRSFKDFNESMKNRLPSAEYEITPDLRLQNLSKAFTEIKSFIHRCPAATLVDANDMEALRAEKEFCKKLYELPLLIDCEQWRDQKFKLKKGVKLSFDSFDEVYRDAVILRSTIELYCPHLSIYRGDPNEEFDDNLRKITTESFAEDVKDEILKKGDMDRAIDLKKELDGMHLGKNANPKYNSYDFRKLVYDKVIEEVKSRKNPDIFKVGNLTNNFYKFINEDPPVPHNLYDFLKSTEKDKVLEAGETYSKEALQVIQDYKNPKQGQILHEIGAKYKRVNEACKHWIKEWGQSFSKSSNVIDHDVQVICQDDEVARGQRLLGSVKKLQENLHKNPIPALLAMEKMNLIQSENLWGISFPESSSFPNKLLSTLLDSRKIQPGKYKELKEEKKEEKKVPEHIELPQGTVLKDTSEDQDFFNFSKQNKQNQKGNSVYYIDPKNYVRFLLQAYKWKKDPKILDQLTPQRLKAFIQTREEFLYFLEALDNDNALLPSLSKRHQEAQWKDQKTLGVQQAIPCFKFDPIESGVVSSYTRNLSEKERSSLNTGVAEKKKELQSDCFYFAL